MRELERGERKFFSRCSLVDGSVGSVHMGLGLCALKAGGRIDTHLHSFEESFYVLEGNPTVVLDGRGYPTIHAFYNTSKRTVSGRPAEVLERVRLRTPTGRLVTMSDVAGAVVFLLDNESVNGVNLNIDGGWMLL